MIRLGDFTGHRPARRPGIAASVEALRDRPRARGGARSAEATTRRRGAPAKDRIPKSVVISEALPRNPGGKLLRTAIAARRGT